MKRAGMLVLTPLLAAIGCAQAEVSLSLGSTESLALSAETAADETTEEGAGEAALVLHVVRTEVHVAAGEGDEEDEGGFTVLSEEARDVDLLALRGTADEIAHGAVPAGRLTQIRLVLDADQQATLIVDGEELPVQVPSASESGLKLYLAPPAELEGGDALELMVEATGTIAREDGSLMLRPTLALTGQGSPSPDAAADRP